MDKIAEIAAALRVNLCLMVDSPEDVSVQIIELVEGTLFRVTVSAADLGKVIGRQGGNARALRKLIAAMGTAARLRISVDIQNRGLTEPSRVD